MTDQLRPILILTALPQERDAVLESLSEVKKLPLDADDSRVYFHGLHQTDGVQYAFVVMCLPNMGRVAASGATIDALKKWKPRVVFLIGIAGGISANDVSLGDVVVAQQIVDYEVQKITEQGVSPRFQSYRVDAKLYSVCQNIMTSEWRDLWPSEAPDTEFEPTVHLGPMVSGDKVVARQELLDFLLEHYPKSIGVEMEAAGMADAASHSQISPKILMIRGVSDLADHDKDAVETRSWRQYACHVAVAFMHAVLRQDISVMIGGDAEVTYDDDRSLYLDEMKSLEEQLGQARVRGENVEQLQSKILEVRRELRAGPQLRQGDFLSNFRYELLERLGDGGYATVWKAIDRKANDVVAVKVLHSQWLSDEGRVSRFLRGANRMRRLGHPNIVHVFEDDCYEDGFRYYVMECAGEQNLREFTLEAGPAQSAAIALKPVFQVGGALMFAHSKGLVHRDVKPKNIIIDSAGNAKLTDFDLLWVADTTGGTRTGASFGTFVFAAPECLKDASRATPASDVFSLAMVAIFVISGVDLEVDVFKDAEKYIMGLSINSRAKTALIRATDWDVSRRTQSVSALTEELKRSLVASSEDELDTLDWLDRGGFRKSCTDRYRASFAEVRHSKDWGSVLTVASDGAFDIFNQCRDAFEKGRSPFASAKDVSAYISSYGIPQSTPGNPGDVDRVTRWLMVRRLIILAVGLYWRAIASDRVRLEIFLMTFLGYVPPDERGVDVVADKARNALFKARPKFTQWGFVPGELINGVESISTIGELERSWFKDMLDSFSDVEMDMPDWWMKLYSSE